MAPSAGGGTAGSKWPWSRSFWGRSSGQAAEPPTAQPRTAALNSAAEAAPHHSAANGAASANGSAELDYDPVPDLMKLWCILQTDLLCAGLMSGRSILWFFRVPAAVLTAAGGPAHAGR